VAVFRSVKRLGPEMYHVSVYRDGGTVHFDAYHPPTSRTYLTSIRAKDIPRLLQPNCVERSGQELPPEPPATEREMYARLVRLLRFSRISRRYGFGWVLTCHREYTYLEAQMCTVGGHKVTNSDGHI